VDFWGHSETSIIFKVHYARLAVNHMHLQCTVLVHLQGGPTKVKPTTILLVTFECV